MKILAISGSNHSKSINKQLLETATSYVTNHDLQMVTVNDFDLPIFSQDVETSSGAPKDALKFRTLLSEHDAFIIACPEHNSMMPAGFKNLIDWASRVPVEDGSKLFGDKPVLLLSTSPGGRGGISNLENLAKIMPFWGADVKAHYSLPSFYEVMTDKGLVDDKAKELKDLVETFINNTL